MVFRAFIFLFLFSWILLSGCQPTNTVVGRRSSHSNASTDNGNSSGSGTIGGDNTLSRVFITDALDTKLTGTSTTLNIGETLALKASLFTSVSSEKIDSAAVNWTLKTISGSTSQTLSCGTTQTSSCDFTPSAPGTYYIEAILLTRSSKVLTYSDTTHPIIVNAPSIATNLTIKSGNGQVGTVNMNLTAPIILSVKDAFGRPVVGASVLTSVSGGGGAIVSANPQLSDQNGEISLSVTMGTLAGTNNNNFVAEVVGSSPALTTTITATAFAGPPHHLAFTTMPAATYAQLPWNTQPVLELQDIYNNRVLSNQSIVASVQTGVGVLSGQSTTSMINGVVSYSDLAYSSADTGVVIRFTTAGTVSVDSTPLNFVLPTGVGIITPDDVVFDPTSASVGGSAGRTFSNTVTIAGLGVSQTIAVAVSGSGNPKLQLNGGAEQSALSGVKNGDTLRVYADPPAVSATATTISVVLGGRTETWALRFVDPSRVAYVFVSSNYVSPSNLGGVSGADNRCQSLATTAGYGGTWSAIFTTGSENLKAHTPWDWGQLRRLDGAIIANGWNDLWDGVLLAPINISEQLVSTNVNVWTGTSDTSTGVSEPNQCDGYTNSGTTNLVRGASSQASTGWIYSSTAINGSCGMTLAHVYCISNPSSALDTTPTSVSFVDQVVTSSTGRLTSNSVVVSGINQTIPVSVSSVSGAAKIKINGGSEVTSGTAYNGDSIEITMAPPSVAGQTNSATLTLGSLTFDWKINYANINNEALVFVTSTQYQGGQNANIAGTHAICQSIADSKGLGGTWSAMVNEGVGGFANLRGQVPWNWGTLKRLDGQVVANSWDDLWDGTLQNPINVDENLTAAVNHSVWTGALNSSGLRATMIDASQESCRNWSSLSGFDDGITGLSSSQSATWVYGGNLSCDTFSSFYCISNPNGVVDTTPNTVDFLKEVSYVAGARTTSNSVTISGITQPIAVSVTGASGTPRLKINGGSEVTSGTASWGQTIEVVMDAPSVLGQMNTASLVLGSLVTTWQLGYADSSRVARIFVTNGSYNGALGGLTGADGICNQEATHAGFTAGSWKALLSDSQYNARDRVNFNWGTLKRIDGSTVIANNWSDLWDGSIQNSVSNTATGATLITNHIYTNTKADGSRYLTTDTASTCIDWTSAIMWDSYGSGHSGSTSAPWIFVNTWGSTTCNGVNNSLYCIEDQPAGEDTLPNSFMMPYKIFQTSNARIESAAVTITGITGPAAVTLSGSQGSPAFKINGGAEVTTGSITNGDTLTLVMTAPASLNQSHKVEVKVGTGAYTPWRVWTGDSSSGVKKRIFITSATYYAGELGGMIGADTKCNTAAAANGNLTGATWKAITSADSLTENSWAINNIGYSWAEIWSFNADGSFKDKIFDANSIWGPNPMTNTMSTDEFGNAVVIRPVVITNTDSSGRGVYTGSGSCQNLNGGLGYEYINTLGVGQVGLINWTSNNNGLNVNCISYGGNTNFGHLYCIEQ
jgi:hypothetical protein